MTKKATQTTDKKASLTVTNTKIAAAIKKACGVSYTAKEISKIKSDFLKRDERAWNLVNIQICAGRAFNAIKSIVGKKDFNEECNRWIGRELNNTERAYMMRLALQPYDTLQMWYKDTGITKTSAKAVFEKFCKENPNDAVEPPKPKVKGGSKGSGKVKKDKDAVLNMDVIGAIKLVSDLIRKEEFDRDKFAKYSELLEDIDGYLVDTMEENAKEFKAA